MLNSTRATLRKLDSHEHPSTRPLKVTICADQHQVAIKISDKGGGIPYGSSDRVWSYLYSTSPPPLESECEMVRTGSPLSGSGMGLPLTRLYARYLGGSCELMNMPGIGVDVYLFLSRVNPKDNYSWTRNSLILSCISSYFVERCPKLSSSGHGSVTHHRHLTFLF